MENVEPANQAAASSPPPHGTGLSLFHVLVIVLSLIMTICAWQFSKYQIETRTEARFEIARDQVLGLITARMQKYEDILWAGAATVESHGGDISYGAWRSYANTLQIGEKYPGISGIGVTHFLDRETTPGYLATRRAERPDFRIHPEHAQTDHIPISFIEPEAPNAAAVGLDLAFETNRRTAALASRDSGEARITGPIVLVQDAGATPGFLFYTPFYRGGTPATVDERRERIVGTVYAPFVTRKLMEGLLAKELREVRFSITDDGETIYDEHSVDDPLNDPDPMFTEQVLLNLYGRTWTLDMRTNLAFHTANTFAQPTFILMGGLVIEGLIIALLLLMARANQRSIAYADKVTVALKHESEMLTDANRKLFVNNEELEQFAYVTSHDLKTPIRGIGGLAEMMEDDLEDYFASPDANPDVAQNLGRIRERVRRMNELTNGIMEFSRIGRHAESEAPVDLSSVIDALRSDFGVTPDQLKMVGTVAPVGIDTFSFRRIIENLVSNAVKYHDGVRDLEIVVSAQVSAGRLHVSVTDNGPGIDSKYHGKIFEMFQTLRVGNAPESTGIGLAIVKKSIERHGGRIVVTSSPGQGATFGFDWPLARREPAFLDVSEAA